LVWCGDSSEYIFNAVGVSGVLCGKIEAVAKVLFSGNG